MLANANAPEKIPVMWADVLPPAPEVRPPTSGPRPLSYNIAGKTSPADMENSCTSVISGFV
jgi:hypothetical protein